MPLKFETADLVHRIRESSIAGCLASISVSFPAPAFFAHSAEKRITSSVLLVLIDMMLHLEFII